MGGQEHMKVFSTKVVSLHRASDTEPKKHKNLLGKPLLKKLHGEIPRKVSLTLLLLPYFPILLVKHNYCSIPISVK